ncbi:DUF932 domain-containing protein [Chitinophaga japonensis]|uniref:Phage/plasmid-like protein (TIGR03299 family) n=1 Tax=Chitinophaga japonensis TaxID=104662 RepID=A0A562T3H5_CHIJA|nr:DUF932 domain-containing protein [Chitinophaga japonensis]TWI87824.1 phage/plasmid-like protein (TIGR03299 family) [Chitinophaga japonensis]
MSHNLFFDNDTNKHSFFSTKEKAWHGLGTVVSEYPTAQQAIRYAGLDFHVSKQRLFVRNERSDLDGLLAGTGIVSPELVVPDYYATVRTDKNIPLGVVGKNYEVVQNADAFAFLDSLVSNSADIRYETAGALGRGERIFITVRLPDYIRIGGSDDVIERYLFITTSHDGSGSILIGFTPVRIVCANTLNAALHNCSNVKRIRHTAKAKDRLQQAAQVLHLTRRATAETAGLFNRMAVTPIMDRHVRRLIEMAMAPSKEVLTKVIEGKYSDLSTHFKNTCEEVVAYAMGNETQQLETTKGTLFGAYNAVTGYYQNVKSYKTAEKKIGSILYGGTAQQRGQRAFDLCVAYMENGVDALQLN